VLVFCSETLFLFDDLALSYVPVTGCPKSIPCPPSFSFGVHPPFAPRAFDLQPPPFLNKSCVRRFFFFSHSMSLIIGPPIPLPFFDSQVVFFSSMQTHNVPGVQLSITSLQRRDSPRVQRCLSSCSSSPH